MPSLVDITERPVLSSREMEQRCIWAERRPGDAGRSGSYGRDLLNMRRINK
jgi:hypothetical protein